MILVSYLAVRWALNVFEKARTAVEAESGDTDQ
jgi:hypothetical protein